LLTLYCRVEQGRNFAKFKAQQSPWSAWHFSTTTLYPQLHVTSILSPLHALNFWPHVEATYYCMFLSVSHISQSWLSSATLLHPRKPGETILLLLTLPFLLSTHPRVCMEEWFSIQVFLTAIKYRLLCHRLCKMMIKQLRSHHRRRCIGQGEWPVIYDVTAKIDDNLSHQLYPHQQTSKATWVDWEHLNHPITPIDLFVSSQLVQSCQSHQIRIH